MRSRGKLLVTIAVVLAFFGYQFLIHTVTIAGQFTPLSAALVLVPFVVGVGWAIALDVGLRQAVLIIATLVLLALAVVSVFGFPHSAISFGLPHMVTNLFLMWFFARTLKEGREPLITTIARRVHGSLKPEIESYTRTVTIAWSLFFAMQILASIALFSFAPLKVWSTYINLLNGPLIILMFILEYTYRVLRYREHQSSIFSAVHFFTRDTAESKSTKAQ